MAADGISRAHRAARHIIVVGHGMVGHRLVEALRARDTGGSWRITVFAEEADAAYDRVGLTSYTESWDRALLALPGNDYAGDERVRLLLEHARRRNRSRDKVGGHRRRPTAQLRHLGAGHRVLRIRPAGARPRPAGVPRLPHARRPRRASAPTPSARWRPATPPRGWSSAAACWVWKPLMRCASSACRRTSSR